MVGHQTAWWQAGLVVEKWLRTTCWSVSRERVGERGSGEFWSHLEQLNAHLPFTRPQEVCAVMAVGGTLWIYCFFVCLSWRSYMIMQNRTFWLQTWIFNFTSKQCLCHPVSWQGGGGSAGAVEAPLDQSPGNWFILFACLWQFWNKKSCCLGHTDPFLEGQVSLQWWEAEGQMSL